MRERGSFFNGIHLTVSSVWSPNAIPITTRSHSLAMASPFIKAAAGIAGIAYLDAKYGLGSDVKLGRASSKATLK